MSATQVDYKNVTIVGKGVPQITCTPGDGTTHDESTVTRVFSTEAAAASFTLADLGSKTQITRLTANDRQWHFEEFPLFRILLWSSLDPNNDPRTIPTPPSLPIYPEVFSSEVVVQNASGFTITWSDATYGSAVVTGTFTGGIMKLTCQVTLGVAVAAIFGTWGLDFPILVTKPYETATKDEMIYVSPERSGHYVLDATTTLDDDVIAQHPGSWDAEPIVAGEAAMPACVQGCALVHPQKNAALIIATKDTDGHMKEFRCNGTGTATKVWVRQHNTAQVSAGSNMTTFFEAWVHPFKGDAEQAVAKIRDWGEAASVPGYTRGLLSTGTAIPSWVYDAGLYVFVNSSANPLTTPERAHALAEITAIKEYYGFAPLVVIYRWHANKFADDWPDWSPISGDNATFISDVEALGCKVVLYTHQQIWGAASTWFNASGTPPTNYLAATGNPANSVVVDKSGVAVTLTNEGETDGGGANIHGYVDFGDTAARTHVVDQWVALRSANNKHHGHYADAISGLHLPTNKASLAANQRGAGSSRSMQGIRTTYGTMRTQLEAIDASFSLISETPTDMTADLFDAACVEPWTASLPNRHYAPVASIAFAHRTAMFSFNFYGVPPVGYEAILGYDFAYNFARAFHWGAPPGWYVLPETTHNVISVAGDPNFAAWQSGVEWIVEFTKVLTDAFRTGPTLKDYLRGKKLPNLPGSYDENIQRDGMTYDVSTPTGLHFSGGEVQSSVWQNTDTDEVAIIFTNTGTSEATFSVRMDAERYPELVGMSALYSNSGGTRTLIKAVNGSFSGTVRIASRGLVVWEVA
jgi:hypothetical protein